MAITEYLTRNPCYKSGRIIDVKGLMLHSVGCSQPNPRVFMNSWNKESCSNVCVHGFIGADETYINLPCMVTPGKAMRGWHGASGKNGSANNTHLGFEMTEPACIKYVGGATFTVSNKEEAVKFVNSTTKAAVKLFAELCIFHKLDPLADGVVISHAEGFKRGIASNHGDPDHLWRQLGMDYNMDRFRKDVADEIKRIQEVEVGMIKEEYLAKFTDEDAIAIYQKALKSLSDNDSSDYSKEAREWAIRNKIILGSGGDTPNYMWQAPLTREQFVTILYRMSKAGLL